jgi:pimeloyl-ACP methyl ester carboxylesterase
MANPSYNEIEETNNGFTYKYYEIGTGGKTLIFLHGLAGCKDFQPSLFRKLLENNTCFFLDLPGHNNLVLNNICDTKQIYQYLQNFLKYKNLDKPILIGFSIGENVAYSFSKTYFAENGVVIPTVIWSSPLFMNRSYLTKRGRLSIFLLSNLPKAIHKSKFTQDFIRFLLKILKINLSDEDVDAIIKLDNTCLKLYKCFLNLPLYPSSAQEKTLFVYGTNDLFVDQSIYEQLKLLSTNEQKYLIPNGGHFGDDVSQQESASLIRNFVDAL